MITSACHAGAHDIVIAGGMESMSNVPHHLAKARAGYRLGHGTLVDGMIHDGLWDPYVNQHMGQCAESCAQAHGISRAQQDEHALESFRRATDAAMSGATGMVHCPCCRAWLGLTGLHACMTSTQVHAHSDACSRAFSLYRCALVKVLTWSCVLVMHARTIFGWQCNLASAGVEAAACGCGMPRRHFQVLGSSTNMHGQSLLASAMLLSQDSKSCCLQCEMPETV